jgi:hypothetical protein
VDDYQQHRDVCITAGTGPRPDCRFCWLFLLAPAAREAVNDWRGDGRSFLLDAHADA